MSTEKPEIEFSDLIQHRSEQYYQGIISQVEVYSILRKLKIQPKSIVDNWLAVRASGVPKAIRSLSNYLNLYDNSKKWDRYIQIDICDKRDIYLSVIHKPSGKTLCKVEAVPEEICSKVLERLKALYMIDNVVQ
jgi:hypothetical protein